VFCADEGTARQNDGAGASREERVSLFSLFFPEIYSERGVVFGRDPSLRAIRGPRKQQNLRCSAAVFRCFSVERAAKIAKVALSARVVLTHLNAGVRATLRPDPVMIG